MRCKSKIKKFFAKIEILWLLWLLSAKFISDSFFQTIIIFELKQAKQNWNGLKWSAIKIYNDTMKK